jgi:hypothetical protein
MTNNSGLHSNGPNAMSMSSLSFGRPEEQLHMGNRSLIVLNQPKVLTSII